jgi:hypothetical protein
MGIFTYYHSPLPHLSPAALASAANHCFAVSSSIAKEGERGKRKGVHPVLSYFTLGVEKMQKRRDGSGVNIDPLVSPTSRSLTVPA